MLNPTSAFFEHNQEAGSTEMFTIFLHGFWGAPSDWQKVVKTLSSRQKLWIPDLYRPGRLSPSHNIDAWATNFCEAVVARSGGDVPIQAVGYSMGGRLLTAAITRAPSLFRRVLLVSAYSLPIRQGQDERIAWEMEWSSHFIDKTWEWLENAWDQQSLFQHSRPLQRRRTPRLRERLVNSLHNWSPTQHTFSCQDVRSLPPTVEWVFGSSDEKYQAVAQELIELPVQGRVTILPDSGHRLLCNAPEWIGRWVEETTQTN